MNPIVLLPSSAGGDAASAVALFMDLNRLVDDAPACAAERFTCAVRAAEQMGRLTVRRAFGDLDRACAGEAHLRSAVRRALTEHRILLERVRGDESDSARTRLIVEAVSSACLLPALRRFVLAGVGVECVPLLEKLHELDRRVAVVGVYTRDAARTLARAAATVVPCRPAGPGTSEGALQPRRSEPDAAAYRAFFEILLKSPMLPRAARLAIYAQTARLLQARPSDTPPLPLVRLAHAVAQADPAAGDPRTIFKLLIALSLGGVFAMPRDTRHHAVQIGPATIPHAGWDEVLVRVCLAALRRDRPGWPLLPSALGAVFELPPDTVVRLAAATRRATPGERP